MTSAIRAFLLLAASAGFGPLHVWRVPDGALEELHRCSGRTRLDCVKKVLRRHRGTPEAFDFYRKTGWFLSELQETGGPIRVATLVDPWRANENQQPALVGGKPPIVYPEEASFDVEKDGAFRALKERFPNLLLWKPGAELEGSRNTPEGQSFVFRYRLLDGCHACPVRGYARVEFLFAPDGAFRRASLAGITPAA